MNFWLDKCLGEPLVNTLRVHAKYHFVLSSRVCDWWVDSAWYIKNNIQLAFPSLPHLLAIVSIHEVDIDDTFVWKNSKDGQLSLKDAYNFIVKPKPLGIWKSFPWDLDTPPSHSMVLWILMHRKLPTNEIFKSMGLPCPVFYVKEARYQFKSG